jgi:tRNA 5-methylaminomethyl-2-thiouridine biosynthesis bifunctional protein
MEIYDYVIIGAGIAGCSMAYFLQNKKTLIVDKEGICQKASNAAGAFLFPKVGFNTKYTKFVNNALLYAFKFYEKLEINLNKQGVLILPRNKKDIEKFQEYKKTFTLPYEEKEGGFFFESGGVLDPQEVCKKLTQNIEFKKLEITFIKKEENFILNDSIQTKNLILATGAEKIFEIPYIKIRPVWGERIEIKTNLSTKHHYHKNCSVSTNLDGIVKIGATHERRWSEKEPDIENANILINKAKEILKLPKYSIHSMKAGMRAGSIDYFPIIGPIIDTKRTLEKDPQIKKGKIPKEIIHIDNLYIINGGGGRGFSNYIYSAKFLSDFLLNKNPIPEFLDTKRLFIKYARKIDNKTIHHLI